MMDEGRTVVTEGQEIFWAFLKGERCLATEGADTAAIGWLWISARQWWWKVKKPSGPS